MKTLIPALLLAGLLAMPALAQTTAFTLPENRSGDVTYISGGIGDEERDEIRQREANFNLKLLFSERDGSYLTGVDVLLLNAKGETVLDAKAAGPFLLARVPAGRYTVKLSANGKTQQGKVSVGAKGKQQAVFRW
jgi:hypothetical protein